MKIFLPLLATVTLLTSGLSHGQSGSAVSLDFFYENLDPYGDWREVGDYGYCWQPRNVNSDWSPYSDGRWLYSDVGWTWDSDEPYGWAVYHYGRWANVASIGWIWVPGTEWGPGWVSWRQNDRYVGWAPLPPEARFSVSIGFSSWVDNYYGIGPGHYRFVENRNFGSRRLGSVFVDQSQNYNIVNQTTNITNIRYENNTIRNDGPRYDQLSRMSAEPLRQYKLQRRQDYDQDSRRPAADHFRSRHDDDSLSVFAPPMDAQRPSSGPGRHAEKVADARINHGWDRAGSPDEIAALRRQMKGSVDAPKDLPPKPRFDRDTDRPGNPASRPNADRPPKGQPNKPTPRVQDTPPSGRPDMKKPEVRKPESPKPETRRPDAPRPETKKPETRKPQPPKPETRRPDAPRPETKKPEARKPQPPKPETRRPDAPRPETKKPEARKPQPPKPETRRPDAPRPETKKPEARKPQPPKPETRRPDTKKPESRPAPPKREQPQAKAPPQRKPEASRPAPTKPQRSKGDEKKPDKKNKSDAKSK
jgi:hypothetical protein